MTTSFPGLFLVLGGLATIFKGFAGLTSGACRASINAQMAIADNLGDVTAKLSAQGMLSYVFGTSIGVYLFAGTCRAEPRWFVLFIWWPRSRASLLQLQVQILHDRNETCVYLFFVGV